MLHFHLQLHEKILKIIAATGRPLITQGRTYIGTVVLKKLSLTYPMDGYTSMTISYVLERVIKARTEKP